MFSVEACGQGVALLRMDDGKVNAMGPAFVEAFGPAWKEATEGGRSIVLAGNGRAFCAGLDLKTLPRLDADALRTFVLGFLGIFRDVALHPRPVVAAVDGPAMAGGAVLALCADHRLVGPRAKLSLTEVRVGVPFPEPVLQLARDALPPQELGPAVLEAITREGEACVRHGWAHGHEPTRPVAEAALDKARALAELSPHAYAQAKRAMRSALASSFALFEAQGIGAYMPTLASPRTMKEVEARFAALTGRGA